MGALGLKTTTTASALGAAIALAACATAPQSAAAPEQSADAAPVAIAAVDPPPAKGSNAEKYSDEIRCVTSAPIGSRIKKRRCMTEREWAMEEQFAEDQMDKIRGDIIHEQH